MTNAGANAGSVGAGAATSPASPGTRRGRDIRAIAAVAFLVVVVTATVAGPLAYPVDPDTLNLAAANAPPDGTHPLGTDESGRDVLARLLRGARVSLSVGFAAMAVAVLLGTAVGALAALGRRWSDALLMRLTDAALSLPVIFVVITTLTFLGPTVPTLILAIGATSWMGLARLVRGELLTLRTQPFVEAAQALGASPWTRFSRHLAPHLVPTVLVNATLGVGTAILTESALSFVGLGIQPPAASWGNMLSGAQSALFSAPRLAIYPGLLIVLTVVAINLLGDALRDALDPAPPPRRP